MGGASGVDVSHASRRRFGGFGTVTDVFNFINDSESEIDFEYQGQSPATLEMTNYSTVSNSQSTSTPVPGADSSFHEYKFVWSAAKIRVLC